MIVSEDVEESNVDNASEDVEEPNVDNEDKEVHSPKGELGIKRHCTHI